MKKLIKNIVNWFLVVAVLIFAGSLIGSRQGVGGFRLFVVESGSMEPKVKTGSVVAVKGRQMYNVGDIVTFAQSGRKEVTVTHRIVDFDAGETGILLTTKGDANEEADGEKVPVGDVIGKVFLTVPLMGYIVSFTRTLNGYLLLVILPAVIIIFGEMMSISRELEKIKGRNNRIYGWQKLKLALLFIALFNPGLRGMTLTKAALTDRITTGASFKAASWPTVKLDYFEAEHIIKFNVHNTGEYKNINYSLTYKTDSLPRGDKGNHTLSGENKFYREIITGTDSSGDFVYYSNVHDIRLKVKLTDGEGNMEELTAGI